MSVAQREEEGGRGRESICEYLVETDSEIVSCAVQATLHLLSLT